MWQPVRSRFQIGAELDRVLQRDTDKLFGVHDYGYAVTTGKVSLFYQPSDSLEAQLDIGRYLAGDYGSTLTLTRTFTNGWRVGVFATLTNVPFNRFGEGSFDKGFIFVVPLAWITGHPTTQQANFTLRPIQRDGGAQLNIRNRLHEVLRGYRQPEMAATWGAFWR